MTHPPLRTIDQMRKAYTLAGLHESEVDADPITQFARWFEDAKRGDIPPWLELNAMTLSTADMGGAVTSRIVLLKGVENGRFVFFTNYTSTKGKQIELNPQVSLCFLWPHQERQIRIRGLASKSTREASIDYFHSRPRGSQLGAWVSEQSSETDGRDSLEQRLSALQQRYGDAEVIPCPEHWGGYAVDPREIEFWQGRENRLHDRLVYRKRDSHWALVRLCP